MKILIAEDDPISRRVLQANLIKWGYDVTLASSSREALEIMGQPDPPSLLISDWSMSPQDVPVLCREIRKLDPRGYTYIILLTTKGEKKDIIQGLEAGADDFLTKPFNQAELKYRIGIGERIINLEHRVLQMADKDPLTEVMSRRPLLEKVGQETERAHRNHTPLSLVLSNVDRLNQVNETYGEPVGDLVLQCFAKTLKRAVRPYDFLGRYAGKEFMVCMPGTDEPQALKASERLRKAIEEMEIILPDSSGLIRVTASFGVATWDLEAREEMGSLIKRTDDALDRAKEEGWNRVCGG